MLQSYHSKREKRKELKRCAQCSSSGCVQYVHDADKSAVFQRRARVRGSWWWTQPTDRQVTALQLCMENAATNVRRRRPRIPEPRNAATGVRRQWHQPAIHETTQWATCLSSVSADDILSTWYCSTPTGQKRCIWNSELTNVPSRTVTVSNGHLSSLSVTQLADRSVRWQCLNSAHAPDAASRNK